VSLLESRTPGFACTPEKAIQWSQVSGARGPWYLAPTSNPSVSKSFIQILTDDISAVCGGAIMMEPLFSMDFQRHHFHQVDKVSWRNVR
jgi:hypothetical protein